MSSSRVTSADLQVWRAQLATKEPCLPQQLAGRLLDEVELLQAELASARRDFARKAADALEKRLRDVRVYNHGGCPSCKEAEARAFLAKLKKVAGGV